MVSTNNNNNTTNVSELPIAVVLLNCATVILHARAGIPECWWSPAWLATPSRVWSPLPSPSSPQWLQQQCTEGQLETADLSTLTWRPQQSTPLQLLAPQACLADSQNLF